jgi:hypothetical protein
MSDAIKFIPNFNNTNITINLLEQMSVLIEDKNLGDVVQGIGFNRDMLTFKIINGEIRLYENQHDVLQVKE